MRNAKHNYRAGSGHAAHAGAVTVAVHPSPVTRCTTVATVDATRRRPHSNGAVLLALYCACRGTLTR